MLISVARTQGREMKRLFGFLAQVDPEETYLSFVFLHPFGRLVGALDGHRGAEEILHPGAGLRLANEASELHPLFFSRQLPPPEARKPEKHSRVKQRKNWANNSHAPLLIKFQLTKNPSQKFSHDT